MKKTSNKTTKKTTSKKVSKKATTKKASTTKPTVKKSQSTDETKKNLSKNKTKVSNKNSKKLLVDNDKQKTISKDPEVLLAGRRHPRGWKIMTYEQKLDYIASRIIAEDRQGITSHKELKESGILSTSQYERRRNREVYSQTGDLDAVKVNPGIFSRSHTRDLRGVRSVPKSQISKDNTNE